MYDTGKEVPQDYKEAVKWYGLAAEQGDVAAQYELGMMYLFGEGVLQHFVRAHMWLNIAAANGEVDAPRQRDLVAKQMTPRQIEQAQEFARECVRKEYKGC